MPVAMSKILITKIVIIVIINLIKIKGLVGSASQ